MTTDMLATVGAARPVEVMVLRPTKTLAKLRAIRSRKCLGFDFYRVVSGPR